MYNTNYNRSFYAIEGKCCVLKTLETASQAHQLKKYIQQPLRYINKHYAKAI